MGKAIEMMISKKRRAFYAILLFLAVCVFAVRHLATPSLHEAAANGYLGDVKKRIEGGAHLEVRDEYGQTPLYLASQEGRGAIAQYLIEAGADVDAPDKFGQTPMYAAARSGHAALVKMLVESGADVEAQTSPGKTPLYAACLYERNKRAADYLLDVGADISVKTRDGTSLLGIAENAEIAERLIQLGLNPNATEERGNTPLHYVHDKAKAEVLIEHGANVDAVSDSGRTPLFGHVQRGNLAVVKALLEHGANVNARSKDETTPILAATRNAEMMALLSSHGARLDAKGRDGSSLLHLASSPDVAEFLIDQGMDLEALDNAGNTPLHRAVESGRQGVLKLLIRKGCNIDAKNANGQTALHTAFHPIKGCIHIQKSFSSSQLSVSQTLVRHGIAVGIVDKFGKTALDYAKSHGFHEAATFLTER
ncbi:ankyrin repeat domain-containing protein [Candidatus Sumerlaeota bacterium]